MISVIFLGNTDFSIVVLKSLLQKFKIFVVTKKNSPVEAFCRSVQVEYMCIGGTLKEHLDNFENAINEKYDFICCCDFGLYIPKSFLTRYGYFSLNIHPSPVPKYRGPAPIQRAIMNLEEHTGVSFIEISEKIDAGGVFFFDSVPILNTDTYSDLRTKLANLAARNIVDVIDGIYRGALKPVPQDETQATFAPKIKPEEEKIKITDKLETLRYINALSENPGGHILTALGRLKIFRCNFSEESTQTGVLISKNKRLLLGCFDGALEITECQLEGRKKMSSIEFLNGYSRYLPLNVL